MMSKDVQQTVGDFFEDYPLRRFEKGEVLIRPEERLENIFYLVEGSVIEYDISSAGNEVIVNAFKPDAFFPMSIAINNTPNYYHFEAATSVTVRIAPAERVIEFVKEQPEVLFDLLARVYRGTDGLQRRMAHLMGGNARSRLIFELVNAAYRFGEHTSDGTLVPLTENDLARRSGLSRETISRAMNKLKTEGYVAVQPTGIVVFDIANLEDLLGSDL
ncbi:MAG TPA: Crp/Fnr family transcriptional regulator [Candidatus Saccharimonadales bacterium]